MSKKLEYQINNDAIRKTPDRKVSVTDVIGFFYRIDSKQSKSEWSRLTDSHVELNGYNDIFNFPDEDRVLVIGFDQVEYILDLLPRRSGCRSKKDLIRNLKEYISSDLSFMESTFASTNDIQGLKETQKIVNEDQQTNAIPVIAHQINDLGVNQRTHDGYINATELCKACGKRLNDYLRLQQTKEFSDELARSTGIPADVLIHIISSGYNDSRGTWVHPQVAINLAQWASPKFAVAVSKWVFDWMNGDSPQGNKLPFHIRRYLINRNKIPPTHFSMLDQMTIKLLGALESKGYMIPDKLMPDISLGKTFSNWLKAQGYDPKSFPTYTHVFDDGIRPDVEARLYPNELMTAFNKHLDSWIESGKALAYFSSKDQKSIEPLNQVLLEIDQRKQITG